MFILFNWLQDCNWRRRQNNLRRRQNRQKTIILLIKMTWQTKSAPELPKTSEQHCNNKFESIPTSFQFESIPPIVKT